MLTGPLILARLGFALTALGMGKSLEECRREQQIWPIGDTNTDRDVDFLDFLTAKKLLFDRRIQDRMGTHYANVINACFSPTDDRIKYVKPGDHSFIDGAEETIMMPLYECYMSLFP